MGVSILFTAAMMRAFRHGSLQHCIGAFKNMSSKYALRNAMVRNVRYFYEQFEKSAKTFEAKNAEIHTH
jgi:hypothetical protein